MADPVLFTKHVTQGLKRLLVQFQGQPNFEGQLRSFLNQVQDVEDMLYALIVERYLDTAIGAQLDGLGRVVNEPRLGRNDLDYRTALRGRIRSNRAHSRIEDLHELFALLLPGFTFTLTEGTLASFVYTINQRLVVGGSGVITQIFNTAGTASALTAAPHGLLFAGVTVVHTNIPTEIYNGTFIVTSIIDDTSYTFDLAFGVPDFVGGDWVVVSNPSAAVLDAQLQVAKGAGIRATLVYSNHADADFLFTYASGDVLEADTDQGYADDISSTGGVYAQVTG